MRDVVASFFITLDGVVEGPGPGDAFELAGWTMPYWDGDIAEFVQNGMQASDALLLGRVTYQGFAAAFASGAGPDAERMNNFPKYVVSTTLERAEWNNSTLIKGNVAQEVAKLKQEPGKDIAISGSGELVGTLLQQGLVDRLNLLVYPVVLGRGKRLWPDGYTATLQLDSSKTSASGVMLLSYRIAKPA